MPSFGLLVSGAMAPANPAERQRATARQTIELAADRVVRRQTRIRRFQLLSNFRRWIGLNTGFL